MELRTMLSASGSSSAVFWRGGCTFDADSGTRTIQINSPRGFPAEALAAGFGIGHQQQHKQKQQLQQQQQRQQPPNGVFAARSVKCARAAATVVKSEELAVAALADVAAAPLVAAATSTAAVAVPKLSKPPPPPPPPPTPPAGARPAKTRIERFGAAAKRVWAPNSPAAAIANVSESLLALLEPGTRPLYADAEIQLVDNFAPVDRECPPTAGLEVVGTIPSCLNGAYVRNGSNPQYMPSGGYHLFDGDGMLQAVRIKDGIPSYCCRFTRTNRHRQERAAGQALFPCAIGGLTDWAGLARLGPFQLRALAGVVDHSKGLGTANAGLAFYNGKLLAMSEDDLPYAVAVSPEDGDLRTLGRYHIAGAMNAMTANPKIDPVTGEMFSYIYNVMETPYVHYWGASADGKIGGRVALDDVQEPVLLHDFGVTENYAVIPGPTMIFRLSDAFAGRSPILMDEGKVFRFGVLPKRAGSRRDSPAVRWFDFPGVSCVHYCNAWEEGDEVVIVGSNGTPPSPMFGDPTRLHCHPTEYRMNLRTGKASERRISTWNLDMGRINEGFYGRKGRYAYMCMAGPWPKYAGIVKLDLHAGHAAAEVGIRRFPAGCYGSEPVFVPRDPASDAAKAEDDGYVVTFLHNQSTNVSELCVLDARSPTLEPVATITLPVRVPYGFHGIFLTEEQLASQRSSLY